MLRPVSAPVREKIVGIDQAGNNRRSVHGPPPAVAHQDVEIVDEVTYCLLTPQLENPVGQLPRLFAQRELRG